MRPSHRSSRTGKSNAHDAPDGPRYVASGSHADAIEQDAMAAKIEFYRNEAQRLLRLAASSTYGDAKAQFLALAQQYETLAEHAAERTRRRRS